MRAQRLALLTLLLLNNFKLSVHNDGLSHFATAHFVYLPSFSEGFMTDITLFPDERLDKVNEDITLIQKKDGLTFGTDAFLLASYIKPMPRAKAVELGAGTGIISFLLATRGRLGEINAIEIQEDFASLAQRNAVFNNLDGTVHIKCADVLSLKPADIGGEADVVFSNPPYMKTDSGKRNDSDYKYIARHEVCGDINDFCAAAFRLLKHGGLFYAVWRPDRLTDIICAMRAARLEPKIMTLVHADRECAPSMMLVCAKKGAAPGITVTPPLFMYDGKERTQMSERALKIYETMSFDI